MKENLFENIKRNHNFLLSFFPQSVCNDYFNKKISRYLRKAYCDAVYRDIDIT